MRDQITRTFGMHPRDLPQPLKNRLWATSDNVCYVQFDPEKALGFRGFFAGRSSTDMSDAVTFSGLSGPVSRI